MDITELIISIIATAIITIIVAYIFIWRGRRIKCFILPTLSLARVKEEVKEKTELYYENKKVENISSILLKIKNTGLKAIKKENFVTPLKFIFDDASTVVSVNKVKPENIEATIDWDANTATCKFNLLNCGDEVVIKFTLINGTGKLERIEGRIEDIRKIPQINGLTDREAKSSLIAGMLFFPPGLIVCFILFLMLYYSGLPASEDWLLFFNLVVIGSFVVTLGLKNLYDWKTKLVSEKAK